MKSNAVGKQQRAARWLLIGFVLGQAMLAVHPAQADKKDPPPPPPPSESKALDEPQRDERDEKTRTQQAATPQQQAMADDCPTGPVLGDADCGEDDFPVEGPGDDLYTRESTDLQLDEIRAFGGAIDPLEGFLDWIAAEGSDVLADCALSACDDGDDIFDAVDLLEEAGEVDLCLLGLCVVDPVEEAADGADDPGELDNCQISITCETGDETSGQDGSDEDQPSSEICEQEEDGDEHCEDNTEGQYGDDHYEASDPTDTDGDGIPDETEENMGTDPEDADSDDDGLTDGEEVGAVSSPGYAGDGWESDPLDADSDNDGFGDMVENWFNGDPNADDSIYMCDILGTYNLEPEWCHWSW